MMTWLVSTALRLRVIVLVAAVVLMVIGVRSAPSIPLDVFPEFAPPLVEIQTEAPGLSTESVESLVTIPLENALNGTPWLKTIRSKSVLGLSSVVLIFEDGTDLTAARALVQERLAVEAARLPTLAHPPVILQPLSSTSRVMKIGITSPTMSQMEMTDLALWTMRPRLMAVRGVANVAIWGQRDRQMQVLVDPQRLQAHEVSLDAVVRATRDAVAIAPGGFLDTPNQRLAVRQTAPVYAPQDLAAAVVDYRGGAPMRLGDVADVRIGFPPPIGDAVINDGPGLLLIVEKNPWANTLEVTRNVESAIELLKPGLTGIEIDTTIFRPATFIEMALANLKQAMLLGCVLVIVVRVLFLFDWRAALISAVAIPLSLVAAVLVLYYYGGTINTMVLAGLVIALGSVVDDAIIDVENIVRRLRLNRASTNPQSPFRVVLDASLEVRSAIVFASLIVIIVFVPVFFLGGLAGSFFRPLAAAYVLAIVASLVVALTVTPAMCLVLLRSIAGKEKNPPVVRAIKLPYRVVPRPLIARPAWSVVVLLLAIAATGASAPYLGEEFLPKFKEYDFLMHWAEKPGTSLDAMRRITVRASNELRAIPGVRNSFGSHIGRAEVADEVVGPNFTELWISVNPKADYETTVKQIEETVEGYPGLYRDVLTYLRERIKEVLTGTSASIVVRIYGPDLATLRDKAQEVSAAIGGNDQVAGVDGVRDLKVQSQVLVPQIEVQVNTDAAAQFGLRPSDVFRAVGTIFQGARVGEIYEKQKTYGVMVWGVPQARRDVRAMCELPVEMPSGGYVRLGDVADVVTHPTPNVISRESASRYIDVTCNVAERDLASVAKDIEQRVRGVTFENEYHPELKGEYAAAQASRNRLFALSGLAVMAILLLLHADFRSIPLTLLIFLTLPFALIGGGRRSVHDRRHSFPRLARRIRHRDRHRGAQWHHARQPLPSPGTG